MLKLLKKTSNLLLLFKKTSKVTNHIQMNQQNKREKETEHHTKKNVQIYRPINIMVTNLNYQLLIEY